MTATSKRSLVGSIAEGLPTRNNEGTNSSAHEFIYELDDLKHPGPKNFSCDSRSEHVTTFLLVLFLRVHRLFLLGDLQLSTGRSTLRACPERTIFKSSLTRHDYPWNIIGLMVVSSAASHGFHPPTVSSSEENARLYTLMMIQEIELS